MPRNELQDALLTLQKHGVVELVQPYLKSSLNTEVTMELDVDEKRRLLVLVDLDRHHAPPPALQALTTSSDGHDATLNLEYIAWSSERGYSKLDSVDRQWKDHIDHTQVAQPRKAGLMLEAILCRILKIALSGGLNRNEECVLTAGGPFATHASELMYKESAVSSRPARSLVEKSSRFTSSLKKNGAEAWNGMHTGLMNIFREAPNAVAV